MLIYAPSSPSEHRVTVADIMASLPANDHEIIPPPARKSTAPSKHAGLADELRELKTWRRLAQVNDGVNGVWHFGGEDGDDLPTSKGDRELIGPGAMPRLIEFASEGVEYRETEDRELPGRRGLWLLPGARYAVGGDIERGDEYDASRPLKRAKVAPLRRVGGIHIAAGGEYVPGRGAPAFRGQITKVQSGGGWKYFSDESGESKGASVSKEITQAANDNLAAVLRTTPARYIKSNGVRRTGLPAISWPKSKAGLRDMLVAVHADGATAFPDARKYFGLCPADNDNTPALPCGSRHPLLSFVGMQASAKKEQVDTSAQVEDRLIELQFANSIREKLDPEHVVILDAAIIAANFREIGELFGYKGKTAERRGKQLVYEAVGRLSEILKKMDAA